MQNANAFLYLSYHLPFYPLSPLHLFPEGTGSLRALIALGMFDDNRQRSLGESRKFS